MATIFINYRIKDSNDIASRLEGSLSSVFGEDVVWRDKTGLQGSQNWPEEIRTRVKRCQVMLVLIGPEWQRSSFEDGPLQGFPRLYDPEDWVRQEITLAIELKNFILPILLNGTQMPKELWLNNFGLKALSAISGQPLHSDSYEADIQRLITVLQNNCHDLREYYKRANAKVLSPSRIEAQLRASIPPIPIEYITALKKSCADVRLLGLRPQQGQAIRLKNVHVPATTLYRPINVQVTLPNMPKFTGRIADPEDQSPLLLDLLEYQSLYVPGDPGAGKSTLCRWIAWLICEGTVPQFEIPSPIGFQESLPITLRARLPLLVELRELWKSLPTWAAGLKELTEPSFQEWLFAWLETKRFPGIDRHIVAEHLKLGTLLVMLDGVDEMPLSDTINGRLCEPRMLFLSGLIAAASTWIANGNRLILTSRPYGITSEQSSNLGFETAPIQGLPEPLQKLLVDRWFHCLCDTHSEGAQLAEDMLAAVNSRVDLQPLISNPMLLTAMCIVYRQGPGGLPHDRFDVYDRIVENVLRNKFCDDTKVVSPVRNRLAVIAHAMHTNSRPGNERPIPQTQVTFCEIDRIIEEYQGNRRFTEEGYSTAINAREELLNSSGLLLPRGEQVAGFYHLTIQEFLAAQRMADLCDGNLHQLFLERSGQPAWRGTLAFMFGWQLWRQNGDPEISIKMVSDLIDQLGEKQVGLGIVLGECLQILLRRGFRLDTAVESRYCRFCVNAVGQSMVPFQDRIELGNTLGELGDPRVLVDLRERSDCSGFVCLPPRIYSVGDDHLSREWTSRDRNVRVEFQRVLDSSTVELTEELWISRFPITNSQFATFISDDGYERRELWCAEGWMWRVQNCIQTPMHWREFRFNGANRPVVGVSWFEADAFSKWAGCRLPTEVEWEICSRDSKYTRYPWGDEWVDGLCNSRELELLYTTPVGMFPSARSLDFGLEDVIGNVSQWCANEWIRESRTVEKHERDAGSVS